jgi:transposase
VIICSLIYTNPVGLTPHTSPTMKVLTLEQHNHVISLLDSGHSGEEIHSITGLSTGVISKTRAVYHPNLPKAAGGHPCKLSKANVHHALHLISSRQVENAVEVTRALRNVTNQPLSSHTVRWGLKKAGMRAVVKKDKPLLTKVHRRAHVDFALEHQH